MKSKLSRYHLQWDYEALEVSDISFGKSLVEFDDALLPAHWYLKPQDRLFPLFSRYIPVMTALAAEKAKKDDKYVDGWACPTMTIYLKASEISKWGNRFVNKEQQIVDKLESYFRRAHSLSEEEVVTLDVLLKNLKKSMDDNLEFFSKTMTDMYDRLGIEDSDLIDLENKLATFEELYVIDADKDIIREDPEEE